MIVVKHLLTLWIHTEENWASCIKQLRITYYQDVQVWTQETCAETHLFARKYMIKITMCFKIGLNIFDILQLDTLIVWS